VQRIGLKLGLSLTPVFAFNMRHDGLAIITS